MNTTVLNIAAYRFVSLQGNLPELRDRLHACCARESIRGTILLAGEGINLFVAGAPQSIASLRGVLDADSRLAGMEYKESWSKQVPFRRLKVKIKREIIAFGMPGIDPARRPAPALDPETLKAWMDEGREVILLDTRNSVEFDSGTFAGAVHLGNGSFRAFAEAAQTLERTSAPVVTFCTGGIRCEKAAPLLLQLGHKQVFQLSGGILNYFRRAGQAHYHGDCFVFDERAALDSALHPAVDQNPVQL